jgi:hypothetical protein
MALRNGGFLIYPCSMYNIQDAAQKQAIVKTDFSRMGWRLDECLRKGGGHFEDVVFKK